LFLEYLACVPFNASEVRMIPQSPDALLGRKETAAALTEAGFPIAAATLTTMACRGGGPPYRLFGPRALYRWGDSLDWARLRLSPARRSAAEHATTAEGDAA
jgi:hypothetical protein